VREVEAPERARTRDDRELLEPSDAARLDLDRERGRVADRVELLARNFSPGRRVFTRKRGINGRLVTNVRPARTVSIQLSYVNGVEEPMSAYTRQPPAGLSAKRLSTASVPAVGVSAMPEESASYQSCQRVFGRLL
jgi:hypothetical protein